MAGRPEGGVILLAVPPDLNRTKQLCWTGCFLPDPSAWSGRRPGRTIQARNDAGVVAAIRAIEDRNTPWFSDFEWGTWLAAVLWGGQGVQPAVVADPDMWNAVAAALRSYRGS